MKTRHIIPLLLIFFFSTFLFADSPDFTIKKIGEGVYAAVATEGGKAGSNAGFIVGSNGVIVVDTF